MTDADASPFQRGKLAASALLLLIIGLGVVLRTLGFFDDTNGLWWDEASWLIKIDYGIYGIRPPGYVMMSKKLIELSPTEAVARTPSYIAGLLALPVFLWASKNLKTSLAATAFGLFVLAVHPWAVDYSKEFKPYAIDLLAHVTLVAVSAWYFARPSWRRFLTLGFAFLAMPLFSWSAACVAPGVWIASALFQWKRKARIEQALHASATAMVLGAALWMLASDKIPKRPSADYWGAKYGVFYQGEGLWGFFEWFGKNTLEIARFPGQLDSQWGLGQLPGLILGWLMVALVLCGLYALIRRKSYLGLALWLSPWLGVVAANLLGVWPYGVFRTNLFMLVYALGLATTGFDALVPWLTARLSRFRQRMQKNASAIAKTRVAGALAMSLALPFIPFHPSEFAVKRHETGAQSTSIRQALPDIAHLAAAEPGRRRLVMDQHACGSMNYYQKVHPRTRWRFRRAVFAKVRGSCLDPKKKRRDGQLNRHFQRDNFFLYVSHPDLRKRFLKRAQRSCRVKFEKIYPTGDVLIHCLPKNPRKDHKAPRKRPAPEEAATPATSNTPATPPTRPRGTDPTPN